MLIDEVFITFKGGNGGAGRASFYPGKKAGPDGGDGGKGGDVYIKATSDLTALNQFSKTKFLKAEDGQPGGGNKKTGKAGADLTINLPVGSLLKNLETDELIEFTKANEIKLICQGGFGGKGNFELRSSTNTTPKTAQPGFSGQEKKFFINLRFLADFGLIGLPNSGKSSLLNELTKANVKVANYPFTTLEPNLGVFKGKVIADIPGLIEGASLGKGLGIKFLKHIEKVNLLLHCISVDSSDLLTDYQTVINELKSFDKKLAKKKRIILLTKTDLTDTETVNKLKEQLKKFKKKVLGISIYDFDSIEKLKSYLV